MRRCVSLEAAAEAVCDQSSIPPLIFQLPPEQGRKVLEKAQDSPVHLYPADISTVEVDTGSWGTIRTYLVMPQGSAPRNAIFYIHGAGWVFGSFHTHGKLVRELAARTHSLVRSRNTPAHRRQNIPQPSISAALYSRISGNSWRPAAHVLTATP